MRLDAGRETAEFEAVDLPPLLAEVQAIIEPLAQHKQLALRLEAALTGEPVRSDPRKLRQILINLLGNAVKFTARGEVAITVCQSEAELVVRVRDTGPGIAAAHQDRLCEPFWQADSSFTRAENGTGLGLTIASRFGAMLGGAIEAGSTVGKGTTLTLRLPLISRCGE